MDRTSIEKFATSARRQLMEDVKQRLFELGLSRSNVTKGDIPRDDAVGLDNKMLTPTQANQRQKLIAQIESDGYDRVVEQAAYTWFNRFTALRFMEVNGYLPSGVRVLSAAGEDPKDTLARPDVLRHATTVPLPVNRERVLELRYAGDDEALYRYLLIAQCDELAEALPFLFDHVNPWVELLFPRNALAEGSVIRRIVAEIPEEDWRDQVEIVGWLYQYYVSERKDQVYKGFKKRKKASKEDIPPATQLFTPNWIVRYMVDNSLGRLWLESRPHSKLR
ncbi:MAG TPA: SAM-dependent methyltransferase, partial [Bacillota bacterium]|nr:SAM-dependent methyltransferase [Bacillota bacterium]